ncbi:hypothetical protein FGB62_82g066 [Gracilaria domingensis]|nr:hypothetical protein FGB62_82g066 [Gracilaria domingensis]
MYAATVIPKELMKAQGRRSGRPRTRLVIPAILHRSVTSRAGRRRQNRDPVPEQLACEKSDPVVAIGGNNAVDVAAAGDNEADAVDAGVGDAVGDAVGGNEADTIGAGIGDAVADAVVDAGVRNVGAVADRNTEADSVSDATDAINSMNLKDSYWSETSLSHDSYHDSLLQLCAEERYPRTEVSSAEISRTEVSGTEDSSTEVSDR